jgi:16S rRNA G1207 methylase RsmC
MTHYYSEKQDTSGEFFKITAKGLEFFSGSGVFSKKELDRASELLIDKCFLKDNWEVLDLGCGIGVIGILILKRHPSLKLTFSDVNERAITLTKKNLLLHKIEAEVIKSDSFKKINKEFDTILLNPPMAAGRQVCYKLIEESFDHLKKNGLLQIVARHKKGGEMLEIRMEEVFGNVETIAKKGGFRIYISRKN